MTHLDLCSGYGGFALAAEEEGFRTVAFAEIEPYACQILNERWPGVPNLGDIRNVTRDRILRETGGIPTVIGTGSVAGTEAGGAK